ncbi:hypothetical protein BGX38DRAFT_1269630 [Terfezia claveryi]|nr:hypothetical protein BGX38DRAFT_1269630 [Terfezia claveryi]
MFAKVKANLEARDGSKEDIKEKQEAEGCKVASRPPSSPFQAYALAAGWEPDPSKFEEGDVKIEVCLGLTLSKGWDSKGEEEVEEEEEEGREKKANSASKANGKEKTPVLSKEAGPFSNESAGGEEDEKDQELGGKKGKKSDPVIYKSAASGDDGVVFTGVSQAAEVDTWDMVGAWDTVNEGDYADKDGEGDFEGEEGSDGGEGDGEGEQEGSDGGEGDSGGGDDGEV